MDFDWATLTMEDFTEIQLFGLTHGKTKVGSTRMLSMEEYKRYMKLDTVRGFVRKEDGELIAMLILVYFPVKHKRNIMMVSTVIAFCVHVEHRGRGIGKRLVSFVSMINRDRTEKHGLLACTSSYHLYGDQGKISQWTIPLSFKTRIKMDSPHSQRVMPDEAEEVYQFLHKYCGLRFPTNEDEFQKWISAYPTFIHRVNGNIVGVWSHTITSLQWDSNLSQEVVKVNYQVVNPEYVKEVIIEMVVQACLTGSDRVMGFMTGSLAGREDLMTKMGIGIPDQPLGLGYHGPIETELGLFHVPIF